MILPGMLSADVRSASSPCLLDSYSLLTVDDKEYGRGAAKKLAAAKEEAARMALRRLEENFE